VREKRYCRGDPLRNGTAPLIRTVVLVRSCMRYEWTDRRSCRCLHVARHIAVPLHLLEPLLGAAIGGTTGLPFNGPLYAAAKA
jgi:hypothetical protein